MSRMTMSRVSGSASFFFSSRRRHTRLQGDWSSDVCSSDLLKLLARQAAYREILKWRGKLKWEGDESIDWRSEERRVGKECRWGWSAHHERKKREEGESSRGGSMGTTGVRRRVTERRG